MQISIIMPCFNCESTVEKAINSILNQSDWDELILINDCSKDNTLAILKKVECSNVKVIDLHQNSGAGMARNIGVLHATSDIIGFLDSDDEHVNGTYTLAKEFLIGLPQLHALRFGTEFRNFPIHLLQHTDKVTTLLNTFIPNLFIKRHIFNILGGFPVSNVFRKYGGEDGVLSYLLQQFFLVGTNYTNNMLIHHWHEGVHAQKFLEKNLTQESIKTAEVVIASQQEISKKTNELSSILKPSNPHGFIEVFKH